MKIALLLVFVAVAVAAEQPTIRAALLPAKERKPAPQFALSDASGRAVKLKDYRGKVVLLDFWATWCGGCKAEIPWFTEIQQRYGGKRFAVIGVSLDEGGWRVLKPFLADAKIPYQMLLGDDSTARAYGARTLPDTFLIDRKGNLAAIYRAGLVNQADVESKIQALLAGH